MSPLSGLRKILTFTGGLTGSWLLWSRVFVDHDVPLNLAIDAERREFWGAKSCQLSYYSDTDASGTPIVLIHSINAAASAYEMRNIFSMYRGKRPVYALDLPGFGFSERSDREYSPELYKNAILDLMEQVIGEPADVVTLSLGGEFASFAALERPEFFRSITMISPTGFTNRQNKTRGQSAADNDTTDSAYNFLSNPVISQPIYDLLVTRVSMRYFLSLSFHGPVDEQLLEYDYATSHQPGAHYAPIYFVSGKLFTPDIKTRTYEKLEHPVMVIYDRDNFAGFDTLPDILERRPNWRARRIPNTLGLPQFERPDKVQEALDNFWEELEVPAR